MKPGRKEGPSVTRDFPVEELDRLLAEVYGLRQMVAEVGDICLHSETTRLTWGKAIHIRDVFTYDEKSAQVSRNGPLAEERRVEYS